MDLRRRTSHLLAGSGALLVVAGLSLGGGVALAAPGPAAQPPADAAKATTTSSDTKASDGKSSDDKSPDSKSSERRSKNRKSKTDRTGPDSSDSNSSPDSSGGSGSKDSTATNGTTPPSTSTPTTATTRPRPSTRSTATTSPPPTATTAPPATASTEPATADPTPADTAGPYDGAPYQANEAGDDAATSTTAPRTAKAPVSRSGSGLPPGGHPIGRDTRTADSSPAGAPTPSTSAVSVSDPVVAAESQPKVPTTSSPASGAASDPATATAPAGEVSGTETERGDTDAARSSGQLGQTGDGTRRLIIFGGVALLMGAVVVACTGREHPALAAASLPVGPARRPRLRRELDGWEDGVPLAPAKRELARNRLGISVSSYYDDELGV